MMIVYDIFRSSVVRAVFMVKGTGLLLAGAAARTVQGVAMQGIARSAEDSA